MGIPFQEDLPVGQHLLQEGVAFASSPAVFLFAVQLVVDFPLKFLLKAGDLADEFVFHARSSNDQEIDVGILPLLVLCEGAVDHGYLHIG